jgi:hypothetical protein
MFFPKTKGAIKFYHYLAKPVFKMYEAQIDQTLKIVIDETEKIKSFGTEKLVSAVPSLISNLNNSKKIE